MAPEGLRRPRPDARAWVLLGLVLAAIVSWWQLGLGPGDIVPDGPGWRLAQRFASRAFSPALAHEGELIEGRPGIVAEAFDALGRTVLLAALAMGIAIVFPVLMLAILDMYPRQRGAASSMQQVTGLAVNTLVAGLLSPAVSHHRGVLAMTSGALTLVGWALWRSYRVRVVAEPRLPEGAEAVALEPADRI